MPGRCPSTSGHALLNILEVDTGGKIDLFYILGPSHIHPTHGPTTTCPHLSPGQAFVSWPHGQEAILKGRSSKGGGAKCIAGYGPLTIPPPWEHQPHHPHHPRFPFPAAERAMSWKSAGQTKTDGEPHGATLSNHCSCSAVGRRVVWSGRYTSGNGYACGSAISQP